MDILEILKKFKLIQPDSAFKETSKRAILAQEPAGAPAHRGWSAQRTFWRIVEVGAAVVLTGFFVLLLTGSLFGPELAPVQYSAVDPQSLRAEAQAIDIQIQLANLNYSEAALSTMQTVGSAKPVVMGSKTSPTAAATAGTANGTSVTSTASSTASSSLSLDQALQGLTQ